MAELSRVTGVPIATIKYYRREGLLPAGHLDAPNQAIYDQSHVARLELIRVMREVAGLAVSAIGEVLQAVDDPSMSLFEAVGRAHRAVASPLATASADPEALAQAEAMIRRAGWHVHDHAPARAQLAHVLSALHRLGRPPTEEILDRYVRAADLVAREEAEGTMQEEGSRDEAVTTAVVGTVLYEQVLTAMRRLAQEHHARERGNPPSG